MMVGIVNDILKGFDNNQCTIMLFLDLSAAFDTIDIDRLLQILADEIGLSGMALQWCKSFLSNRTQRVKILGEYSEMLFVKYGVPQGSVLGPKFFNIYVRSQPEVFKSSGFDTTSFADDANGMKTFSISFQYSILKYDVAKCIDNVANWMNVNFLKINQDKTEMILFHPKSLRRQVIIGGTFIGEECIRFSKYVKNVGVTLDNNLTLDKHVNNIVSYTFKLLKNIGRVRKMITDKQTEMLVHAVSTSRLDYCNSLFINMNKANLFKLQKVQNASARLIARKSKRQSVSGIMKKLHWLKVESRIVFKILLLMYKCVTGRCSENLKIKYKNHNFRPQDDLLLETGRG